MPLKAPPVFGMAFGASAGLTGSPAGAGAPIEPLPPQQLVPQPLSQQLLRRKPANQLRRPQPLSQLLQLLPQLLPQLWWEWQPLLQPVLHESQQLFRPKPENQLRRPQPLSHELQGLH
jgi:hypothetical protein